MQVSISRALHTKLLALAAAEPTCEVCGLLFGTAERIEGIEPCTNVAAQTETSFEIDPLALIAAHKRERAGGPKIIGCYHSHPNGVEALSPHDLAQSEQGSIWAIAAGGRLCFWQIELPSAKSLAVRFNE